MSHRAYIAAEEEDWSYAPAELDQMTDKPYDERAGLFVENAPQYIARTFRKSNIIYREHTDASYTTPRPRDPKREHLGIVAQCCGERLGDSLKIVFKNNAHFPFSMHPTVCCTTSRRTESRRYRQARPSPKNAKGTVNPDGTPKDVDREFVAISYTADENQSCYLTENITKYVRDPKRLEKNTQFIFRDIEGEGVNVSFARSNVRETVSWKRLPSEKGTHAKMQASENHRSRPLVIAVLTSELKFRSCTTRNSPPVAIPSTADRIEQRAPSLAPPRSAIPAEGRRPPSPDGTSPPPHNRWHSLVLRP
jgi:hypothetical protein